MKTIQSRIKYNYNILKTIFIIFGCYYFSLRYIFPGYFNPLIPHHSDLFDYFNDFKSNSLISFIKSSRMTGDFILSLVGNYDFRSTIFFGILLTIVNIFFLIKSIERIFNIKVKSISIILFTIVLFSHPGFYINYTFDIFSTISFTFFIILIFSWYKMSKQLDTKLMLILSLLVLLIFTSKETYTISVLLFWIFQVLINGGKERNFSIKMLVISFALLFITLLRSKIVGSSFVSFSNDLNSPYYVSINLLSIFHIFIYYMKGMLNPYVLSIIIIILIYSFINKKYFKEIIMLFLIGIASYAPYTVLPNHVVPHYIWVAVPFTYSILLVLQIIFVKSNFKVAMIVVLFIVIILNIYSNIGYKHEYLQNEWAIKPEAINTNILRSIPFVNENIQPSDKVLITGLYVTEETPYKSLYFMKNVLKIPVEISVITTRNEDTTGFTKLKNIENINLDKFDKVFAYDEDGNLVKYYNENDIKSAMKSAQDTQILLYPDLKKILNDMESKPNDWYLNMTLGNKYLSIKDRINAKKYLSKSVDLVKGENPYPYYFMGQLMEMENNKEEALFYYKRALLIEPKNKYFSEAVNKYKNIPLN